LLIQSIPAQNEAAEGEKDESTQRHKDNQNKSPSTRGSAAHSPAHGLPSNLEVLGKRNPFASGWVII
jgi:hypothetical protein